MRMTKVLAFLKNRTIEISQLRCRPALMFFPESERTGPPVGGRRRTDRPGHSRGASAAGAGGDMVSSKAARDNALFGRVRQSSHCQQEEQSRAAAAVGGQHEKGCRAHGDGEGPPARAGAAPLDRGWGRSHARMCARRVLRMRKGTQEVSGGALPAGWAELARLRRPGRAGPERVGPLRPGQPRAAQVDAPRAEGWLHSFGSRAGPKQSVGQQRHSGWP